FLFILGSPHPRDLHSFPTRRSSDLGTLDILVGLGMLAIPGLGPMVGESTLKAGLAGLGVDSAVGDVAKALIHMGVPELEAKRYEDRKSTRLNSSHLVISYAVFCLKK